MAKIKEIIRKGRRGEPVLISDLRKQVTMSKAVFDALIIELAKSGGYSLSRNAFPPGSLSEPEVRAMVPDGEGRFYDTINVRPPIPALNDSAFSNDKAVIPAKVTGKDGMTLAAIAAADGTVHLDTVRVALDNSAFGNPKAAIPDRVIGKDGKSYPTSKPRSTYLSDADVKKTQSLPDLKLRDST